MNSAFTCVFARHGDPTDDCDLALFYLLLLFLFISSALYVQTLTDKQDDASWGMIVSTALAPVLAEFCFSWVYNITNKMLINIIKINNKKMSIIKNKIIKIK